MKNERRAVFGICILLALAVWLAFGEAVHSGFIDYDDDVYIYQNDVVQHGLTLKGIGWALTYGKIGHWHPLTWISHMLDCQYYGLNAGGHHLTSLLLHTAAVILLFLVLRQMTACLWRSAFVAAVFAVHPLRVESVVWVAERKDVLAAFFFMLTLGAYVHYTRKPSSRARHAAVALLFALGLLSKNMLVTLPFVLLLLDYWPLNRIPDFRLRVADSAGVPSVKNLIVEKIPLFALSAASCVATFLVPEKVAEFDKVSFASRIENSLVSYVIYLRQMIWPVNLATPYPNPARGLPLWESFMALALLAAISIGVFAARRNRPYCVTGWLWYLGMLVPVIGLVQISNYAHADRYTYLPQIGISVILAWGAVELFAVRRHGRLILGAVSAIVIGTLIACTRAQTAYWRDSESLWTHTLACNANNGIAHNNLGLILLQHGEVDKALEHFQIAVRLQPDDEAARKNLGSALLQEGQVDEAMVHFQKALEMQPTDSGAENNLGFALFRKGRTEEAIAHYRKALAIQPGDTGARHNLGSALFRNGQVDEAIAEFQKVLAVQPGSAETYNDLANAFSKKGREAEAIRQWEKALASGPDYQPALNNLAWALATCPDASLRNGARAVQLARQACELSGGKNLLMLRTLAAACAENGQFDTALIVSGHALQQAAVQHNTALMDSIEWQSNLYEARQPFHTTVRPDLEPLGAN